MQDDVGNNYIYSSMYADWLARRTWSYFDLIDAAAGLTGFYAIEEGPKEKGYRFSWARWGL